MVRTAVWLLPAGLLMLATVSASGQVPSAVAAGVSAAADWVVPRTPWGHPDLQGIWTSDEEFGIPLERPPDGRIPPQTPGAQLRVVDPRTVVGFETGVGSKGRGPFNGPEDYDLAERCITRGLPNTWFPQVYNNGFQIVQHPDYVAVLYERLHEHRIIPLDGRAHLPAAVSQWMGDSRARRKPPPAAEFRYLAAAGYVTFLSRKCDI